MIRLKRMRAFLAIMAYAAIVQAASCAEEAKPLKKVTIAVGTSVLNITYPWLMMPLALGYWKDEGYDVSVITTAGSTQSAQLMVAGSIQFAQFNSSTLIQVNTESSIPVRGIMNNGIVDWGVAVLDNSSIRSGADFKGKRIGILSLATGGMPLIKGFLRNNGLNPESDVQILPVGGPAQALEALKSDRVDAIMYWQTALSGFELTGTKIRIIRNPIWADLPDYTLTAYQKVIDTDPAMVEAIARGGAKAMLFAATNPDCVRKLQWKFFPGSKPTGMDETAAVRSDNALLAAQLQSLKSGFTLNGGKYIGAMDASAYGRMQDFLLREKQITKTLPPQSFVISTPGFVEAINRFDHEAVIAAAMACAGAQ